MNISQHLSRIILFALCLLITGLTAKTARANQCHLQSNQDFAIEFSIKNADLKEVVRIVNHKGGGSPISASFWINDTSITSSVITDTITEKSKDYQIKLFYTANLSNGRSGTVDYYLYQEEFASKGWSYIRSERVDFDDLGFNGVSVYAEEKNLQDLNCYNGQDIPAPPKPNLPKTCAVFPYSIQSYKDQGDSKVKTVWGAKVASTAIGFGKNDFAESWSHKQICNEGKDLCDLDEANKVEALHLMDFNNSSNHINVSQETVFSGGGVFGNVVVATNKKLTLNTGEYWVNSLILNTDSALVIPKGERVVLHTKSITVRNAYIGSLASKPIPVNGKIPDSGIPFSEKPIIYVHSDGKPLSFSWGTAGFDSQGGGSPSVIDAHIYSERSVRINGVVVQGMVTARYIEITGSGVVSGTGGEICEDEVESYTLELTPQSDYSLLCETQQIDFQVMNQDGSTADDYSGKVNVKAATGNLSTSKTDPGSLWSAGGNVTEGTFNIVNGQLSLYLRSHDIGTVKVSASLVGDTNGGASNNEAIVGNYSFLPFKFSANTQKVVAGKNHLFDINVLGCNDDSPTVVDSYHSSNIPFTASLVSPSSESGGAFGNVTLDNSPSSASSIEFKQGKANVMLNYNESGKIKVELTDPNFDCSGLSGCPIDGGGKLKGSFEVHSRPWTFAICEPINSNLSMDGTADGGSRFIAAGEDFSLRVKPIIYNSTASPSSQDEANSKKLCNTKATKNFFIDGTTVHLRGELHTPSKGKLGTGSALIGSSETKLHTENSGTNDAPWYNFTALRWDEVGSLAILADIGSTTYLGEKITTGSRNIGRFYPHHLTIIEGNDIWDYEKDHDGFAYMGQGIGHNFAVQAESKNNSVTTNYGLFDRDLITDITYKVAVETPDNSDNWKNIESSRILPSDLIWADKSDWRGGGQMTVELTTFSLIKDGSTLDGPFTSSNSRFGLVSSKIDGVDFLPDPDVDVKSTASWGKQFSTSPEFRYGRMVLHDVSGNQGTKIAIPLKVEYWDSDQNRFITNDDDSGSVLNSSKYCTKSIWPDANKDGNVSLKGTSGDTKVTKGVFNGLFAEQAEGRKEQLKIWLRQGLDKPNSASDCKDGYVLQPWLRYYWNGSSEEDPSATITFGIYRGNDRVIYRGENRFLGQ